MRIAVINGTEKRGVTYRLKEVFLEPFRGRAEIAEFDLPEDGPGFCTGCTSCFLKGEETCKDAADVSAVVRAMDEADLIVMTSPAYVLHVTGAMKALLDHLAYRWMPHRPSAAMFGKRAVVITQCIGAGARTAAKDIRHSLSWWGISRIGVFTAALMGDSICWDELSERRRAKLTRGVMRLAVRFARIDYAKTARVSLATRMKFAMCRMIHRNIIKAHPESIDARYWAAQGWLGRERPWKTG